MTHLEQGKGVNQDTTYGMTLIMMDQMKLTVRHSYSVYMKVASWEKQWRKF